ncbi:MULTISPECIES: hypothetical protein [unclassified Levilactobacillus]|uniref:hypothetical protein n=1 Tax=unclassified Levilactobacillus TaxID=2767918 RepID=UPI002FF40726
MKIINQSARDKVVKYNFGDVIVVDTENDYSVDMVVEISGGKAAFLNLKSGLLSSVRDSLQETVQSVPYRD